MTFPRLTPSRLSFAGLLAGLLSQPALADAVVDRGEYLVTIMGCTDCHTPGHFLGQPDMARYLGGSDVGFEIPGLGTFHGPNLTPDATGLGGWSAQDIVAAIRTGQRPDGSQLAPAMPWMGYAALSDDDALAIAAFLQSLPPVANDVPGPFAAGQATGGFVMKVVAP
ncbi:MAG: c-type cytochrome [Paracoccaceae bacterium]